MATYMRASAVGSAAGGLLWTLHALLINRRPEGCIGDTCGFGVMPRPTEDLAWVFLVAVVLIALGTTTLSRHGGRGERSLAVAGGAALAIAGAVALAAGLVVNAVITGDSPLWWLHDSDSLGRVLPVAGSGLVGIGLLRSRLLAPWTGVALILAALASLGFNAQNERVLLTLPLGLAWIVVGYATFVRSKREDADRSPNQRLGA